MRELQGVANAIERVAQALPEILAIVAVLVFAIAWVRKMIAGRKWPSLDAASFAYIMVGIAAAKYIF